VGERRPKRFALGAAIGNELRHLLALGLGWTKLLKQGAGLLQLAALRAQSRLAIDQIPKHAVAIFEVQGTAYFNGNHHPATFGNFHGKHV
jgi:hypothetical protein